MRNWYWIVIAALVLLLALFFAIGGRSPFGRRNSGFAIERISDVDRIRIADTKSILVLDKNDAGWLVNESFVARPTAIDFILKTIEKIEIKSPVSEGLYNELIVNENIEPLKVAISGRRKTSIYYIYITESTEYGSIMRRSLKSKPYFVSLPAYDLDPGSHFVIDDKFWRPYHIFNLMPEQIRTLDISFKDPEMDRLNISIDSQGVDIGVNGVQLSQPSQTKISRYISYFTFVPFERYAFDLDENLLSEIIASEPEIVMELSLSNDNKIIVRFWNRYNETPEGVVADTDRLYGLINGGRDLFIVKYFDLDPLIKTGEYFISD